MLLGVLVLGTGVGIGLGVSEAPSGLAAMQPVDAVTWGVRTTLARGTADVTVGATLGSHARAIVLSGSGQIAFASGATALTLRLPGRFGRGILRLLVVGDASFLQVGLGGQGIGSFFPGKHWISVGGPGFARPGTRVGGNGASSPLRSLIAPGESVEPLGTKTIDGRTTYGFAVSPNTKQDGNGLGALGQIPGLSGEAMQRVRHAAQAIDRPTINVWIDTSGLVRRMTTSVGVLGFGAGATLTFAHFGVPVHLSAPARSDTVPILDFLDRTLFSKTL